MPPQGPDGIYGARLTKITEAIRDLYQKKILGQLKPGERFPDQNIFEAYESIFEPDLSNRDFVDWGARVGRFVDYLLLKNPK